MKTRIEIITKEIAEIYLKKNNGNRILRDKIVNYYADQMKRGQWMLTGQGISFDEKGNLIDGQHRLAAIVKSGISQEMLIIENVKKETFSVYDTGKLRSTGDILKIDGVKNSTNIGGIITAYCVLKSDISFQRRGSGKEIKLTRLDILQTYESMPEFWQELNSISAKCNLKLRIFTISQIGGFMAYNILEKNKKTDLLSEFLFELFGINDDKYTCTKTFREYLIKDALSNRKLSLKTKMEKLDKIYSYWQKGINISKIY